MVLYLLNLLVIIKQFKLYSLNINQTVRIKMVNFVLFFCIFLCIKQFVPT